MTDGTSDQVLQYPVEWLLVQHAGVEWTGEWADPRTLRRSSNRLPDKLSAALNLYPCDLLFVHRDAEGETHEQRAAEIQRGIEALENPPPAVSIIPIRMTEAWLLHDEGAIRAAAGNPSGSVSLRLPNVHRLESLRDPKQQLFDAIAKASELRGRRLSRLARRRFVLRQRVGELIEDYSALRALQAFSAFEDDLQRVLAGNDWSHRAQTGRSTD